MKKISSIILLLFLTVLLGFTSCSRHKREKITDPVQQEALRTRNPDIPVDSLFTAAAANEMASPFKKIAIKKMFADFKLSWASSAETATREKYVKDKQMKKANFTERLSVAFRDIPAEGYSPSLTIYFLVVLIAFVVIFTVKVIKTFFISPK